MTTHDDLAAEIAKQLFSCDDGISRAIGEGCGECEPCKAYRKLRRLAARLEETERAEDMYVEEIERRCERLIRERDNANLLVDWLEDRLRDGSTRGETPEIRAWCSRALWGEETGP